MSSTDNARQANVAALPQRTKLVLVGAIALAVFGLTYNYAVARSASP